MINFGKTIITNTLKGIIGLILSVILYVAYYYVKGFIPQAIILSGLTLLVWLWKKPAPSKNRS